MKIFAILLTLISLNAASVPSISQGHLDATVRHWQHVLSLEDWDIRAHTIRLADMPEGNLGYSKRDPALRTMMIAVLDPQDYAALAAENGIVPKCGKEILRDIEDTVIHELVHLRLRDLVQAQQAGLEMAEELTVNRITAALQRKR